MKFFRRKEVDVDIDHVLLETRAKLAEVELLPESDFTIFRSPLQGGIIHGVDRKPAEVARLKAKIAYLETVKQGIINPEETK